MYTCANFIDLTWFCQAMSIRRKKIKDFDSWSSVENWSHLTTVNGINVYGPISL